MEVADEIVVIAGGMVEQVGTPDDLYDRPANDFVMSFLGPVTRLAGQLVRPHDLEVCGARRPAPSPADGRPRLVRLGFEVRVDALALGDPVWLQLTRAQVDRLGLAPGTEIHLRPVPGAGVHPAPVHEAPLDEVPVHEAAV